MTAAHQALSELAADDERGLFQIGDDDDTRRLLPEFLRDVLVGNRMNLMKHCRGFFDPVGCLL